MMRKRERSIIISCIMIIVMVVCLFSDVVFQPGEVYGYTEKIGVVDVDSDSALNVRDGVGTSGTKVIGKLSAGVTVNIIGEANASDGKLWYKIRYQSITGYVSAEFISNVQDKIDYTEDADFEAYLTSQGFPESYKDALRVLHAKYPKWVFVADHLDYTWDTALTNQSVVGRSLITKNAISSWKSLEQKSYNWDTGTWYTFDGGAWCAASKELVAYYMDPRNFLDEKHIWMFEMLSYQSTFQTIGRLENILTGTFMEAGKNLIVNDETGEKTSYSDIIMIAANKSGVSPFHLAASILVEMGNSGASGSISGTVSGYEGYYNYYNWKAYASNGNSAIVNGLIYAKGTDPAYLRPWNTRYKSLVGGAIMLGKNYISIGQDTLYYKKFDYVGTPYTHQYMTHIRAPEIEAEKTAKAYSTEVKENTSIVFKIPVFKNMPETAAIKPTGDGSPNNCLATLSINGQSLTPTFSKFTTEYSLVVDNSVTSVEVNATSIVNSTKVTGTGTHELKEGSNTIVVTAIAQNGTSRNYTITIVRQQPSSGEDVGGETGGSSGNTSSGGTTTEKPSIEEPTTEEPTTEPLKFSTTLTRDDVAKTINGINPGATAADLKSKLTVSGGTVEIQNSSGKIKSEGKVVTGDKVVVKDNSGAVVHWYSLIIYGDVDGDGSASIKDILIIQKHILGVSSMSDLALKAGDANRDGAGVSIKDILVIQKYILGVSTINQN